MRIQIAVALTAFVLTAFVLTAFVLSRLLQEITKEKHGFLELVRLVHANLMHQKVVSPALEHDPKVLQTFWIRSYDKIKRVRP